MQELQGLENPKTGKVNSQGLFLGNSNPIMTNQPSMILIVLMDIDRFNNLIDVVIHAH